MIALSDRPDLHFTTASGERNLETRVWHAVLAVHGGVFARLNRAMGREFGITLAKFDVLAQLFRNPAGMNQGELSRHLKVTGGNVTGLVRRLGGEGLVTRQMSPDDRRVFVVQLTEAGRETYLAARQRHDALLEEWFRDLASADKTEALRILQAMAGRIDPASKAADR
jgi:DNA-binding MarR family transcriptional regulator